MNTHNIKTNKKTPAIIKKNLMEAFKVEAIKNQVQRMLQNNPEKIEKFQNRVLTMSLNYGLDNCSPESIINCGLQALALDLPLSAGQGYIVAYKGVATFDCGYKGWQVLAKRAGFSVLADIVYSCDVFSQGGFGFNRDIKFEPNFNLREGYNDIWAKQNLRGVIISVMEDKTQTSTHTFVDSGMIFKIVANSPSVQSEKARRFSPHENWAEQMFCAKAIKQIISKFPIDISNSQLHKAIEIINDTEKLAQDKPVTINDQRNYDQDRFNSMFPKWQQRVESGQNTAMSLITFLSNSYTMTSDQIEQLITLNSINGAKR